MESAKVRLKLATGKKVEQAAAEEYFCREFFLRWRRKRELFVFNYRPGSVYMLTMESTGWSAG